MFLKCQCSIIKEVGELGQMQKTSISEKGCRTENYFFYFLNKERAEMELEEMREQDFPINSESKHHLQTFFSPASKYAKITCSNRI